MLLGFIHSKNHEKYVSVPILLLLCITWASCHNISVLRPLAKEMKFVQLTKVAVMPIYDNASRDWAYQVCSHNSPSLTFGLLMKNANFILFLL